MDAKKQFADLIAALERYSVANIQPAVDQPDNDFERSVNEHNEIQGMIKEVKSLLKPLETEERAKRDAIASSLDGWFGSKLREGVNNYPLSNGRKLKYTRALDRKIEASMIPAARKMYEDTWVEIDSPKVPFDDCLRIKYEVDKRGMNGILKAAPKAQAALALMITTKPAAPTMEVD